MTPYELGKQMGMRKFAFVDSMSATSNAFSLAPKGPVASAVSKAPIQETVGISTPLASLDQSPSKNNQAANTRPSNVARNTGGQALSQPLVNPPDQSMVNMASYDMGLELGLRKQADFLSGIGDWWKSLPQQHQSTILGGGLGMLGGGLLGGGSGMMLGGLAGGLGGYAGSDWLGKQDWYNNLVGKAQPQQPQAITNVAPPTTPPAQPPAGQTAAPKPPPAQSPAAQQPKLGPPLAMGEAPEGLPGPLTRFAPLSSDKGGWKFNYDENKWKWIPPAGHPNWSTKGQRAGESVLTPVKHRALSPEETDTLNMSEKTVTSTRTPFQGPTPGESMYEPEHPEMGGWYKGRNGAWYKAPLSHSAIARGGKPWAPPPPEPVMLQAGFSLPRRR